MAKLKYDPSSKLIYQHYNILKHWISALEIVKVLVNQQQKRQQHDYELEDSTVGAVELKINDQVKDKHDKDDKGDKDNVKTIKNTKDATSIRNCH